MSSQSLYNLKAAEALEKAARQNFEKGDKVKAVQQWESAADRYIEERVFDKAIECLENAGLLEARMINLLQVFEPESVLDALQERGLREEMALAHLHLQSRRETIADVPDDENCYTLAAKILKGSRDRKLGFQLLKGAMLAASWAQDEIRLQQAVDLVLDHDLGLAPQAKATNDRILSAKYLRQGGCPLPDSLGLLQRHLWYRTCYLADGSEHEKPRQ